MPAIPGKLYAIPYYFVFIITMTGDRFASADNVLQDRVARAPRFMKVHHIVINLARLQRCNNQYKLSGHRIKV